MPDLSDITAYLQTQALAAVYPNGTGQPSVASMDIKVFEGWPIAASLDLDMQGMQVEGTAAPTPRPNGPCADVSVYPMPGTSSEPYQIQDETYVIKQPTYGMQASVVGNVITITGQPNEGEYLTIIADRQFAYSSNASTTSAILAALAAAASANYVGVSNTSNTLTIPYDYALTVRIGGVGVLGQATHRQRHSIMITTWAPSPSARSAIAAAIDNFLKRTITTTLVVDGSMARFIYSRTIVTDDMETVPCYRRDLIFDVDYATVYQFPGYVITSFTVEVAGGNWNLGSLSIPPTINAPQ